MVNYIFLIYFLASLKEYDKSSPYIHFIISLDNVVLIFELFLNINKSYNFNFII
jgi:hypothetical protein